MRRPDDDEHSGQARSGDLLLRIDRYLDGNCRETLAADVLTGLASEPKTLPSKYFYDDHGSWLFERICELPEYYLTRTEQALLDAVVEDIVSLAQPTHLIELGSGASKKTRILLDALVRFDRTSLCYVPMDVSEGVLRRSALALRAFYPTLRVHGIVGDYEHHIERIPLGDRRLVIFLGSTIGNFTIVQCRAFLRALAASLASGDALLVGFDLVKPSAILHAAYNDAAGVTAEFNRNILRVVNRELGADFDLGRFRHVAFFNPTESQIEMHLEALAAHDVFIPAVQLTVNFEKGEMIRTEISRKFVRPEVEGMFADAGVRLQRWYTPSDGYFALALGVVR
jgi:L-histidine N-alpha-methyltransferase